MADCNHLGMIGTMELPEWIDQPVAQYGTDPIHDGVGKLVTRCVAMEILLRLRVAQLDADVTDRQLDQRGPSWCARRLSDLAELVPEADRDSLREEMRIAVEILEMRNGVVHGYWDSTVDGVPLRTVRTARMDRKTGEPIKTAFNRDYLVGAGDRAHRIWGFLQSRTGWPDVRDGRGHHSQN